MAPKTSFVLMALAVSLLWSTRAHAQSVCRDLFHPISYQYLGELRAQRKLQQAWPTLLKSDRLFSFNLIDAADDRSLKMQSERLFATLPPESKGAVYEYTEISPGYGGIYLNFNSYLREVVKDRPLSGRSLKPSRYSHGIAKMTLAIERAIQSTPFLPRGLILVRGLAIDPELVRVGELFTDFGFQSTSLEPTTAYEFARSSAAATGEVPHIFVIEIATTDVQGLHVASNNENEMLLQRGLKLRVHEISERTMRINKNGFVRTHPLRIVHLTTES